MAAQFTSAEWGRIRQTLAADPARYGLPRREYGSVLIGSFNIRKLGSARSRNADTWGFLAEVCRSLICWPFRRLWTTSAACGG